MNVRRRAALMGAAAAASVAVTACGGSGGVNDAAAGGYAYGDPRVPAPPADAAQNGAPARTLKVTAIGELGRIVVDDSGRALYRFDKDAAKPSTATCAGPCARAWPPVQWTADVRATGIGRGRLGKVRRPDGTWQLTIAGWPMYRYVKDTPGGANGQGMGGTWFASTPTGAKAKAPAPEAAKDSVRDSSR